MFGWSAVQPNCSRNVVLAWKQSVRSNWSNAKIRRPNLHLIFQNTTEPISTKTENFRASTSAFHLGVQDPSVAYREASCIATFKVSECTWLNPYRFLAGFRTSYVAFQSEFRHQKSSLVRPLQLLRHLSVQKERELESKIGRRISLCRLFITQGLGF